MRHDEDRQGAKPQRQRDEHGGQLLPEVSDRIVARGSQLDWRGDDIGEPLGVSALQRGHLRRAVTQPGREGARTRRQVAGSRLSRRRAGGELGESGCERTRARPQCGAARRQSRGARRTLSNTGLHSGDSGGGPRCQSRASRCRTGQLPGERLKHGFRCSVVEGVGVVQLGTCGRDPRRQLRYTGGVAGESRRDAAESRGAGLQLRQTGCERTHPGRVGRNAGRERLGAGRRGRRTIRKASETGLKRRGPGLQTPRAVSRRSER